MRGHGGLAVTLGAWFILLSLWSCTTNLSPGGSGAVANYAVKSKQSVYEETDTRVFIPTLMLESLQQDGLHDVKNEALHALQEPELAMNAFPADRRGGINWVEAIDKGLINPRMSLQGDEQMNVMDMDILFKDTAHMPWVRFPHLAHTRWLDCSNCHPKIFIPQRGGNTEISMDAIIAGRYCGRCHDKVAFPIWTCERCHSVPHAGSPAAWWRKGDKPYPATQEAKNLLKQQTPELDLQSF